MGVVQLAVKLDGRRRVYRSGDTVKGVVTIVVDERPEPQYGVSVRVEGMGRVHAFDAEGCNNAEHYFNPINIALKKGGNPIPVGTHTFPFQFRLPPFELPCSFEADWGRILYTICARISRRSKADTCTAKLPFKVSPVLDLNLNPRCRMGVSAEDCKDVRCLWWKAGPIAASARLTKSGYALGEKMLLDIGVTNHTDRTVRVWAVLQQMAKYRKPQRAGHGWTSSNKAVGRIAGKICRPSESLVWSGEKLEVSQSLPPTDLGMRRRSITLIKSISYELWVNVKPVRGYLKSMCLKLPVTIGTVPICDEEEPPEELEPLEEEGLNEMFQLNQMIGGQDPNCMQ